MTGDEPTPSPWRSAIVGAIALLAMKPTAVRAADQIYFPATTNVTALLVQKINAETVRIDLSAWYLSEHAISIAVANRFNAGVPVRLLGDRGSIFETDANTRKEFYWLASQGVPIRLRYNPNWYPEIDHWKASIFAGQNLVEFGSANYTPFELAPYAPDNYNDETALFSDDPAIVKAFKTKFDQMWNDTTPEPNSMIVNPPFFKNWDQACALESACADYRVQYPHPVPMVIDTRRLEPDNPMPADLIWGQGPLFNNRLITEINREATRVDLVAYRLTVESVADALINKFRSGVPVRFMVDPEQYTNRLWPEYWLTHAFTDKLWAAGIAIKQRRHGGLTHMKMLVTSAYATNASSNIAANWQRDHDYFVPAAAKPAVYQAMKNRFDAMWNDPSAFQTFVPLPADAATLVGPPSGATGLGAKPTFVWNTAAYATSYDIYLGTVQSGLVLVANVPAQLVQNPPATYSWTPSTPLIGGRTYSWKVVSRTFATAVNPAIIANSETRTFKTAGGILGDFNGDGSADVAVYRPSNGTWYVLNSTTGTQTTFAWGLSGDVTVPGDYDGDGMSDAAVFRPSTGIWYIRNSSAPANPSFLQWGLNGDIPVPGDYDGDMKTDAAVFRPSTGIWYVRNLATNTASFYQWGLSGDIPVAADYDGDGKTDVAVFRPSTGIWYIRNSSAPGSPSFLQWGLPGDIPAPGDYDGDGRADGAVFRPSTGIWYVRNLTTNTASFYQWGLGGDVPVPGDFDGDGKTDVAVFRPSNGTWYVIRSSNATAYAVGWGISGDIPILGRR